MQNERIVKVDGKPIKVSEGATVAEVREKAGLPSRRQLYDVKTGNLLLDPAAPAPDEIGTIPDIRQGA